ncbi:MAG TPA: response regulator [Ramlibacter sp.]|nr:response regulator [Ramlibacter sp.]
MSTSTTFPASVAPPRCRVLVVDDDDDCRDMLSELLDVHGFHVRSAFNGKAALEEASAFRPEVILVDLGMPVMDGYEFAKAVRQDAVLNRTFIAAISGWGTPQDREKSAKAGINLHFVKPVDLSTLLALLGNLAKTKGLRIRA